MHRGSTYPSRIGNEQLRSLKKSVKKEQGLSLMLNNKANWILAQLGGARAHPNGWK